MTKKELIDRIKEIAGKLAKNSLNEQDLRDHGNLDRIVYDHYVHIADALEDAGVTPTRLAQRIRKPLTKDEIKKRVRELSNTLGKRCLLQNDLRQHGISDYYLRKYWGGRIGNLLRDCGLEASPYARAVAPNDDELLTYLYKLGMRLGRIPKFADIRRDGSYSAKVFKSRFDSMAEAWKQAQPGGGGKKKPEKRIPAVEKLPIGAPDRLGPGEHRRFSGTAGEYLVVSELLFRGYNAQLLAVDFGIDIIATKGDKVYWIQAKTSRFKGNARTSGEIKLPVYSFEKTRSAQMYYVFVLVLDDRKQFLILPYLKIEELIRREIIERQDEASKQFIIKIRRQNERFYVNKEEEKAEVTIFLDSWDLLA